MRPDTLAQTPPVALTGHGFAAFGVINLGLWDVLVRRVLVRRSTQLADSLLQLLGSAFPVVAVKLEVVERQDFRLSLTIG